MELDAVFSGVITSLCGVWLVFRIRILWLRIRIRIQHFRLNTDPDLGVWWPIIENNLQLEKFSFIFLIKSLQPSKKNIQRFKTWDFWTFFLFLWVIFDLRDQDPDSESVSGACYQFESGYNPKHWLQVPIFLFRLADLFSELLLFEPRC
jgi:hypothetical protein